MLRLENLSLNCCNKYYSKCLLQKSLRIKKSCLSCIFFIKKTFISSKCLFVKRYCPSGSSAHWLAFSAFLLFLFITYDLYKKQISDINNKTQMYTACTEQVSTEQRQLVFCFSYFFFNLRYHFLHNDFQNVNVKIKHPLLISDMVYLLLICLTKHFL